MNELIIFENPEFGSIRTVELDGEPWLVGKDVAAALGYKNPQEAIRTHVDDEDKGVSEILTPGGKQSVPIINESGLYSLVLSSKLPTARKFRRWVTSEVLPSIRKTGGYTAKAKPMTDYQQMMAETRRRNAQIQEARIYTELAKRYKGTSYEQVLNAHATKSLAGEYLLPLPEAGERLMSAGEVGAKLGISSNLVGKLTNKHGLKTDQYGKWMHDKSPYSSKEVPSFRYKECVVDKLREILAEM